jgi:formamidopyrimidine-DNA glycosylase
VRGSAGVARWDPEAPRVPELPEVETVVRLLRPKLEGRRIVGADVSWESTIGNLRPELFATRVVGKRVGRLWRRAKYIVVELEERGRSAGCLVGHLRMTGRMHVEDASWDPGPWWRVRLTLDNDQVFWFLDVRKFGRLIAADRPEEVFAALGPEPLGSEFTAEWFIEQLAARERRIKPLLLDQSFLAGLGNIYVDESLFQAGIHPLRPANRISSHKARLLHGAIRQILEEAIVREGSSFDPFYRTPEGQPGSYQEQFRVYGRQGKPCRNCGRAIVRIVVGQRGTHLCKRCQPAPRKRAAKS